MLFNSLAYAIFLPLIFICYWLMPSKYRWILLLCGSYYFYMSWNPKYVVLILFTTAISYLTALLVEKSQSIIVRRVTLLFALITCLGVLFVFKYYNFALNTLSHFVHMEPHLVNLLLPVGISFYTFQTLSYVIDVYRGTVKAEKNFGIYATFVSFFPQLVAGPIERSDNLLPQIKGEHVFDKEKVYYGTRLILWGLFKKMVVADNLSVYADKVFGDLDNYTGGAILIATIFFTFQIYCDFSGYSDIARGSAKLFGIELMENFKSPYFSTSIRDFWSRWHISLSTWFKDYLYIPLGGNRVSKFRNIINLMLTFLVSGLWHGARWNFVVWGGMHGAMQVYENAFGIKKSEQNNIYSVIRRIVVFAFVALAWIFFRVENIHQGFYAIKQMLNGISDPLQYLIHGIKSLGLYDKKYLICFFLYFVPLTIYDYVAMKTDIISLIGQKHAVIRHALAIATILAIIFFGYVGQSTFVYFQF